MPASPDPAFAEDLASALASAGMALMPARVFSALLGDEDGQMTAAELQGQLGVSAGAVSGAVTYLEPLGLLSRARVPGSRADVYAVQEDAWHEAILRNDAAYRPLVEALERGLERLGPDDPSRVRLELSREFLLFLGREMEDLARRWEEHKVGYLRGRGTH